MRSPRSVTAAPTGMFSRILKFAMAFFAFVTTGFWPVIVPRSVVALSTVLLALFLWRRLRAWAAGTWGGAVADPGAEPVADPAASRR